MKKADQHTENMLFLRRIQERVAKFTPSSRQDIIAASADMDGIIRYASEQTQEALKALRLSAKLHVEKTCRSRAQK